ncbi:MAG: hypothetical protein CL920_34020 [Deltaproteobacteria bacterium]|nr:hypothetical protein [Deltaproteobacteria bacterium]MBU53740.1 hypothetical protein [Deltaproteobacteria bacterium]
MTEYPQEPVAAIRQWLAQPSPDAWEDLSLIVASCTPEQVEYIVDYVQQHLQTWPREWCCIHTYSPELYWRLGKELHLTVQDEDDLALYTEYIPLYPNIESLILTGYTGLCDMSFLEHLPQIKHFTYIEPGLETFCPFEGVEVQPHNIDVFSRRTNMETISLQCDLHGAYDIDIFTGNDQLRTLHVACARSFDTLDKLLDLKQLEELSLNKVLHLNNIDALSSMKSLRRLVLSYFPDADQYLEQHNFFFTSIKEIPLFSGLESLTLRGFRSLRSLEGVEALRGLKSLRVDGYRIEHWEPLAKHKALEHLDVDINSVEDVERIDFPPQLASLTLSTGVHSQWELTSELQWASLARFAHIPSIALHGFRVRGRPEPDLEHVRFLTNEREQNSIWRPF